MAPYESLKIRDFDHLEFAVADLDRATELYLQMGFTKVASREILERQLRSNLMNQGGVWILLSHSTLRTDPVAEYVEAHGDGVLSVAFLCDDAVSALETAVNRGAEVTQSPKSFKKDFGAVQHASIRAFGDVRHTFVSREGNLFAEGFEVAVKPGSRGYGFERIDHITSNVEKGKLDEWSDYYERIFGLRSVRFFDIHTNRSGLYSKVMQSPDGVIKMPVNEPTDDSSQIQEFLNIHHGPGVQHVALATANILETLRNLRREGLPFLDSPPETYYEALPQRIPQLEENVRELQDLGILVDGNARGYLLQIFTRNVVGPFFYEVIQRKGDDGFGEGNFKALFEAIERDQIRRGVLKP